MRDHRCECNKAVGYRCAMHDTGVASDADDYPCTEGEKDLQSIQQSILRDVHAWLMDCVRKQEEKENVRKRV